jgi:serpin B
MAGIGEIRSPRAWRVGAACVSIAALAGLAGCGTGPGPGGTAGAPNVPGVPGGPATLVGHVETLHPGSLGAAQVAAADTAFGFALFERLCAASPTANLTLSPASAAQALGMLDAGAAGPTRAAIGRLLHLPGWDANLVAALHDQAAALGAVRQVTVANHVFEQTGLSPTATALDDLRTAFGADLRQVDFRQEPEATDAINGVISKDTGGLIPKLFGQPLDPSTRTVLADAILLKATWEHPFPTMAPGEFETAAGHRVNVPQMSNRDGRFAGRSVDGWQSVVLPYVGGLQAVAILPPPLTSPSGSTTQCATPSASTMTGLTAGTSRPVSVVMPKLDLTQTLPLTSVLAKMGLPLSGDYSGLGAGDSQISQVVQKVVMKVDQKGTVAAAATGVAITAMAMVPVNPVLTFDRPYFLLLEDTATHTPLFLAHVADPAQP